MYLSRCSGPGRGGPNEEQMCNLWEIRRPTEFPKTCSTACHCLITSMYLETNSWTRLQEDKGTPTRRKLKELEISYFQSADNALSQTANIYVHDIWWHYFTGKHKKIAYQSIHDLPYCLWTLEVVLKAFWCSYVLDVMKFAWIHYLGWWQDDLYWVSFRNYRCWWFGLWPTQESVLSAILRQIHM